MAKQKQVKTVLVVAAHADDEALGCGATIAKHAAQGHDVHILFMADGVSSRKSTKGLKGRQEAARKACAAVGAKPPAFLKFPDNKMDSVPLLDIVQAIEKHIAKIRPSVIYTHHHGDLNIDHRITQKAVMTACRPLAGSTVNEIYGFEILSSTEWALPHTDTAFLPQHFVDVSRHMDVKMKAIKAYDMEMRPAPHSRSAEVIRALATYRGAQAGFMAAEGFTVLRQRVDVL